MGGAASAAFSPGFIKAIDPSGAGLDQGQLAALATFSTLVGGGLAGLAFRRRLWKTRLKKGASIRHGRGRPATTIWSIMFELSPTPTQGWWVQ